MKPRVEDSRFDFRGGLNTALSPDDLNANELVLATNARLATTRGAVAKRTGTKRLHPTTLASGADITALIQWDAPAAKQVVAIAGGNLYHKTSAFGEFTEVVPGVVFSSTERQAMAVMRAATEGAPLVLYIGDSTGLRSWDGTSLVVIDGTDNTPPADLLAVYHLRLFARDPDFPKHLFWSKTGDPEYFTTGASTDGGSAIADILSGESLQALEVVGSSLLFASEDAVGRFTGYSTDDIELAQDTEGITSEVGAVGPLALKRVENAAALLSDKGPYYVNESQAVPIGEKVEPEFDGLDRSVLENSAIGWHRGRREIWYAVPGSSDSAVNKTVYVFAARLGSWSGPWTYSFGITCLARYEDSNGDEWLLSGGDDGFVRHMDIGSLDDVLSDGTGGSAYTMTVEFAPAFFDNAGVIKALDRLQVEADIVSGELPTLQLAFDDASFTSYTLTGVGNDVQHYRVDAQDQQGYRLRVRYVDATTDISLLHGLRLGAYRYERP